MACPVVSGQVCREEGSRGKRVDARVGRKSMTEARAAPSPSGPIPKETLGRISLLAVWSLVCGILAFCLYITALPGLILGIIALVKIPGSKGRLSGTGLAIAGVATSGVALILAPLVLTVMIPAASRARIKGEELKAQVRAGELQGAVMQYIQEYGQLPVRGKTGVDDVQAASDGPLLQVLLGRNRELNPRGVVFFPEPGESLLDPWGRPYQVALDVNQDGRVTLPPGPDGSTRTIESPAVVWSCGPNGKADGGHRDGDDILAY